MAYVCAFALLTALVCAPCACADEDAQADDMGMLSSRYGTLDELANSLNEESDVIVDTRIGVLVAVNRALDGSSVRFEGEVVGEALGAGDGQVWVAVNNSSGQSISVLLDAEQAALVENYGDHETTGSTLQVTGLYHVACDEHDGGLDVHATSVVVLDAGGAVTNGVAFSEFAWGVALCAFGLVLVLLYLFLRHRGDRRKLAEELGSGQRR